MCSRLQQEQQINTFFGVGSSSVSLNEAAALRFTARLLLLDGVLTDESSWSGLSVAVLIRFFFTAFEPRAATGVVGAAALAGAGTDSGDVCSSCRLIWPK